MITQYNKARLAEDKQRHEYKQDEDTRRCIEEVEKVIKYTINNRYERNGESMVEMAALEHEVFLREVLRILQQNYCYPRK